MPLTAILNSFNFYFVNANQDVSYNKAILRGEEETEPDSDPNTS